MFLVVAVFGFFAGYFQMWKPDPIEIIYNILEKKSFKVLNPFSTTTEWAIHLYIERNSSEKLRFIFRIHKEEGTTEVATTLEDLKKMNPEEEFTHIFSYIDYIIQKNPSLNFKSK